MKIRILANTIRLRLKMHEVDSLREHGRMEEILEFGPAPEDILRIQLCRGEEDYGIEQNGMSISIIVPKAMVESWATTDLVGIEEMITTSKGRYIKVFIEKDFACLDADRDEEKGSYPNPMEGAKC